MPNHRHQYSDNKWEQEAYDKGYYDGQRNNYKNPYQGILGGDHARSEIYKRGYHDGRDDAGWD